MARRVVALLMMAVVPVAAGAAPQSAAPPTVATVVGAGGGPLGSVTLRDGPKGVLITLKISGLSPGWHGMHFHQVGDCSAGFKAAGGHVVADHTAHHGHVQLNSGLLNPRGNDAGALPNLFVGDDRAATVELYSTYVSLKGAGGRPALLDADGATLIIHEGPEDQTGKADTVSTRVACALFK